MTSLTVDLNHAADLVTLLVDEVSIPALQRRVAASCAELGLDDDATETVWQIVQGARQLVMQHENREKELTRLSKTVADLVVIRDVDTVLSEVVDQARALLGSDIAYLSVWDPDEDRCDVKACSGALSPDFGASVNAGSGLAGAIVRSGRSQWTADYSLDDRFVHDDAADRSIAAEGLTSILGAPLKSKDSVHGMIFVASRTTRQFTLQEVALLNSLAGHASIALQNAEMFAELDSAMRELRATKGALEERNSMIQQVTEGRNRLMSSAVETGRLEPVTAILAEILSARVGVFTADHALLAAADPTCDSLRRCQCTEHSTLNTALTTSASAFIGSFHRRLAESAHRVAGGQHQYLYPILTRSELHGWIYIEHARELHEVELSILDDAVVVVALVLLDQNAVVAAEQGMRSDFLGSLAKNQIRGSKIDQWARRFGMSRRERYVALLCEGSQELSSRTLSIGHRLATERGGLAGEHLGALAILLPSKTAKDAEPIVHLLQSLAGDVSRVAMSGDGLPLQDVHGLFREARAVLSWMRASGQTHAVRSLNDAGAQWLLFGGEDRANLEWLIGRVLGPITATRAAVDLLTTAQVYLACGSNSREAARAMHLHVNTVNQRLGRIAELLGDDWRFGQRALAVSAALSAWQSLRETAATSPRSPIPQGG